MPTAATVHVDHLLSDKAVAAFASGGDGYIADKMFPAVQVANRSDLYATIDRDSWLRNFDAVRAEGGRSKRIEFKQSSEGYVTKNYALSTEIPLEALANANTAFQVREHNMAMPVDGLLRAQEIRVANRVTSATNIGSAATLAGGNKWSDPVNSNPLGDINSGSAFIRSRTGLRPNMGFCDADTFAILQRHPQMLDLYKYTEGGLVPKNSIAAAFQLDDIHVGDGIVNDNAEDGTASFSNIWGNNFILAHVEPGMTMKTRTFGLRFQWTNPLLAAPMAVKRDQFTKAGEEHVEVVEVMHYQDEKVVARDLSYGILSTL